MTHTIEVENIKCGGCINSITAGLKKINGIDYVTIDKESEKVTTVGNASRDEVVKALSIMGYPERGKNDLLKKVKSYMSCAVGRMNS